MILDGDTLVSSEWELEQSTEETDVRSGEKRPLSPGASRMDAPDLESRAKRQRVDVDSEAKPSASEPCSSCLAPPIQPKAQHVLELISSEPPNYDLGAGDLFLTDSWRSRWCRCDTVSVH